MRELKDKTGRIITIDKIEAEDAFQGVLEGTPYLIRKLRLISAQKYIEKQGYIFHSIHELQQDLDTCDKDSSDLPLREIWSAQVSTGAKYVNDHDKFRSDVLNIKWYQEGGDPFKKLNEIVSNLNFTKICRTEEWEA
jgi:hypothetical protein